MLKGNKTNIVDSRKGTNKSIIYKLNESLSIIGLQSSKTVENLQAAGYGFSVTYGLLNTSDSELEGVHIGFEKAFPFKWTTLDATNIPSRLYVEVMLSDDWQVLPCT